MRIRNLHHSTQYPTNINDFTKVIPVTYNFKGYGDRTFYALHDPSVNYGRISVFLAPPNMIEPFWTDANITDKFTQPYLYNLNFYAPSGIANPQNVRRYTVDSLFETTQNPNNPLLGHFGNNTYVYFLDSSFFVFDSLTDSPLPGWETNYIVKPLFAGDSILDNSNAQSPIFLGNAAVYTAAQVSNFFGGGAVGSAIRSLALRYTFSLAGGYRPIKLNGTVAGYPLNTLNQNGRSMPHHYIFDTQQSDFIAPPPPAPTMVQPPNVVVLSGQDVPEIVFSADQEGTTFHWTIDGDDIVKKSSWAWVGNFPAFKAIETTTDLVATVTVTPMSTPSDESEPLVGDSVSFTITVQPFIVTFTLTKPLDVVALKGNSVPQIGFNVVSNKPDFDTAEIVFSWTVDSPSLLGMPEDVFEGEGVIPSFTAAVVGIANITVTATFEELTDSKQFKITVMATATTGNTPTKGSKKVRFRKDVSDTPESYSAKCQKILASATSSADVKAKAQSLLAAIAAHRLSVGQYNALLKSPNGWVSGFNSEVLNIQSLYRAMRGLAAKEAQSGSMSVHDVQRIGIKI